VAAAHSDSFLFGENEGASAKGVVGDGSK